MITLTWKVTYQRPIPCPDNKPDPYTGQYSSMGCLVYHSETVTKNKTAEFTTEEEAKDFIKKAPNSCYDFKFLTPK